MGNVVIITVHSNDGLFTDVVGWRDRRVSLPRNLPYQGVTRGADGAVGDIDFKVQCILLTKCLFVVSNTTKLVFVVSVELL